MCDYETMDEMDSMQYRIDELEEKLEKIKPILELYANSKIGTLQDNGTYRIDCGGNTMAGSFGLLNNPFGLPSTFTYDPRPAKEALKIIGEKQWKLM